MSTENLSYDELFKLLFKHKPVMESLLRGIGPQIGIPESWIEAMDLDTLKPFSSESITRDLNKRFSDSVWIVNARKNLDGGLHCLAFVHEFQSRMDSTMPMRMEEYSSLIQMDILRAGITPRGKATPVIPLVTYTGANHWTVPTNVADLYPTISDVPIVEVLGSKPYYLIDMCSMGGDDLPSNELISCLIRQQSAVAGEQVWEALREVYRLIPSPEDREIRWVFHHLAKRVPRVPEDFELPTFDRIESMLL